MAGSRPNCMQCQHFIITWDASFPRGCKALGFRCKTMPSHEVYAASGQDCLHFKAKNAPVPPGKK